MFLLRSDSANVNKQKAFLGTFLSGAAADVNGEAAFTDHPEPPARPPGQAAGRESFLKAPQDDE